jgi:broad specificity phosphatase PhoE
MSVTVVLLSHAPTAATRAAAFPADEPLDPPGLAAAEVLAEQARGVLRRRPDELLTSPAVRCVQTAKAWGYAATVEPALRDADAGRWAGRTLAAVAAAEPDAVAAWLAGAAPPGGESVAQVRARAAAWLSGTGTTVAVTHAAVIRALVVDVLGAPGTAFWRIDVPPLTRTVLRGGGDRWTLRMLAAPMSASPPGGPAA